ncbi:hypothetical protein NDU88_003925 [Pleurodeles waltl]|uniref:Uncharacterized protein n=1 Tax=Pleurodeles waltl TaxID=8319 RepID=A0AAV7SHA9_PLEWA|nr:hypothetical protein NDU88_003925 [Pleurodeles waltl]
MLEEFLTGRGAQLSLIRFLLKPSAQAFPGLLTARGKVFLCRKTCEARQAVLVRKYGSRSPDGRSPLTCPADSAALPASSQAGVARKGLLAAALRCKGRPRRN